MNGYLTSLFRGLLPVALLALVTVTGCGEKDPAAPPGTTLESDLPNTVTLTFIDTADAARTASATWSDPDGPGGAAPLIDTLKLERGRTYRGTLTAALVKKNPDTVLAFNPTYLKYADEHQFFYEAKGGAAGRIVFTVTDRDTKGLPLGLQFLATVSPGAEAGGTLNVVLGHYDSQPKDGVTRSTESDIDANLPVVIR